MAIKKHPGINQTTGRLKKGWKWGANKTPVKAGSNATKGSRRSSGAPKTVAGKVKGAVRKLGRKLGTQK